jgi:hypothetical protein
MTFPHTATIRRSTKDGTKYTYSDAGTTQCFLQPLSPEDSQLFGITWSKASVCYIPYETEIQDSDRLVKDGVTYGIRGVKSHNYGSLKHKRLALEEM